MHMITWIECGKCCNETRCLSYRLDPIAQHLTNAPFYEHCHQKDAGHPIEELPRLSRMVFEDWKGSGISEIASYPQVRASSVDFQLPSGPGTLSGAWCVHSKKSPVEKLTLIEDRLNWSHRHPRGTHEGFP